MNKVLTIVLATMFALGGFATFAPSVAAQAEETAVTDPSGDVSVYVGTAQTAGSAPPEPAGAPVPEPLAGPADLTGFKVFGETATSISFELSVQSFSRPNTWQPAKVNQMLCFKWSGTDSYYRFLFDLSYPTVPQGEVNSYPKFQQGLLDRVPSCDPWNTKATFPERTVPGQLFTIEFQPEENLISWTVPRKLFETLHTDYAKSGTLDPRPAAGDTFSELRAYAVSMAGSAYTTYDETDAAEFTFQLETGNEKVKVLVPNNIDAGGGVGGFDTPIYGVEIGSFQTIPVTIENHLSTPIEPNITVTIIAGEPGKWEVRTLPSIPVPKMVADTPGRATVTLIVNSDPTVSHKESVRLLVTALDQAEPGHLGAQAVDVVAVDPPGVGTASLHFHGTGDACSSRNRWINTLATDAAATGKEIAFRPCEPSGSGVDPGGEYGHLFRPDVPFARDYVLSTTENAKATIVLRSVARVPGPQGQDVGVPMVGDITVQILSGSTVIGEITKEGESIPGEPTAIPFEVPIQGRILGGFGREVPNDKGLGVRVSVVPASRTVEIGGCVQEQCTPVEEERDVPTPGGTVYMVYGSSKIDVPIVESERSGDIINITKSGALISLRLSEGEKHVFTNPGRIVVYNLTVRNEGVNVDTARISATLNETGWRAEILPQTNYKLKVGQPRSFNIRVTAPADAVEGESLLLEVFARSTVDENAVAKLPLIVEVTTGQQFEDQEIDERLQEVEKIEDSPGASAVLSVLAVLALLGAARFRRRDH